MTRIKYTDSMQDVICKLSDRNPGALAALCETVKIATEVDPGSPLNQINPLLSLDSLGIYGSAIYVLWSDVCRRNTPQMIMLLRAWALGFISRDQVVAASDDRNPAGRYIDFAALAEQVCERVPDFNLEPSTESTTTTTS